MWCRCLQVAAFFMVLKVPIAFTVFSFVIPLEITGLLFNVFTFFLPVPMKCRLFLHECACWLTRSEARMSKRFLGQPISAEDSCFDQGQQINPLQVPLALPITEARHSASHVAGVPAKTLVVI
jgi:hypothetical protein